MILLIIEGLSIEEKISYDKTPKQEFEISVFLNIIKFYHNDLTIKVYMVFVLSEMLNKE